MRGISWFLSTSTCRSILLRLIFIKLFGNENFSGEKDSGKVLIIIIILFLIKILDGIYCSNRKKLLTFIQKSVRANSLHPPGLNRVDSGSTVLPFMVTQIQLAFVGVVDSFLLINFQGKNE